MVDVRTLRGIELLKLGRWDAMTGVFRVTEQDLASVVEAFAAGVVHRPALKLGHVEPIGEGDPAMGVIDNMRLSPDGRTVLADFIGVPAKLAAIMPHAYPHRSIESMQDFRDQQGRVWPLVITAVALLGAVEPGITELRSLADVEELYAARAARERTLMVAAARRRRSHRITLQQKG